MDVKFPYLPNQRGINGSPMHSSGKFSYRSRSNESKKSKKLSASNNYVDNVKKKIDRSMRIVPSPGTKTKVRAGSLAIADDLSSVNDRDEAGLISR